MGQDAAYSNSLQRLVLLPCRMKTNTTGLHFAVEARGGSNPPAPSTFVSELISYWSFGYPSVVAAEMPSSDRGRVDHEHMF